MSSPAAACMPLHPAYRCPLFDSLQLSSGTPAAISATFGGEVAVVFFAAARSFFVGSLIILLPRCCRGSLPGGVELQGGGQCSCGGAPERRLSSGGSDGPPACFRQLRRRCAAH